MFSRCALLIPLLSLLASVSGCGGPACTGDPAQGDCDEQAPCTLVQTIDQKEYTNECRQAQDDAEGVVAATCAPKALESASPAATYSTWTTVYAYDERRRPVAYGPDADGDGEMDYEERVLEYGDLDWATRMIHRDPTAGVVFQVDYTYEEGLPVLAFSPALEYSSRTTRYTWNADRKLVSVEEDLLSDGSIEELHTLEYDSRGKLAAHTEAHTDGDTEWRRQYVWEGDLLVLVAVTDSVDTGLKWTYTYQYDAEGRLIGYAYAFGDEELATQATYTYEDGRLVAINEDTVLSYDSDGNLMKVESFDAEGEVSSRWSFSSDCDSPWPLLYDAQQVYLLPEFYIGMRRIAF